MLDCYQKKILAYSIVFLEYYFIGNGRCELGNGSPPFRCAKTFARDISSWGCGEGYCTSYEACIGYTYQTKVIGQEKHWCLLHTSNRRCPPGFYENNGPVAAKSSDLRASPDLNYVCYGRY